MRSSVLGKRVVCVGNYGLVCCHGRKRLFSHIERMESLPSEVLQYVVFETRTLSAMDVRSLLLTSKTVNARLRGEGEGEGEHRAMMGVTFCAKQKWWDGVKIALLRGYGDPNTPIEDDWFEYYSYSVRDLAATAGEQHIVAMLDAASC